MGDELRRRIIEETADAVVAVDETQTILFVNRAACAAFGYTVDQMVGRRLETLMPERFRSAHPGQVAAYGASGAPARYMGDRSNHIVGVRADGEEIPLGATILQLELRGRRVYAAILRDIRARVDRLRSLYDLANTDVLTGAYNRRFFLEAAEREQRRAARHAQDVGLLMIDVDRFKQINDRYGHAVGDGVLQAVADAALSVLRAHDVFARWGGEEFVALLPQTDASGALAGAERIRRKIEASAVAGPDGAPIPVTVSVGASVRIGPEETLSDMLRRADAALYQAKADGRNRSRAG
ncbi:MAG: sensor domain-containing diguanylate cyclase [Marivibrio sp.]|uniref:sensor domain-containing diguanylate cyclase n=1 Tax=Marivibrio sp. TaxID=2039719 RepID=UPI0032EFDCDE